MAPDVQMRARASVSRLSGKSANAARFCRSVNASETIHPRVNQNMIQAEYFTVTAAVLIHRNFPTSTLVPSAIMATHTKAATSFENPMEVNKTPTRRP